MVESTPRFVWGELPPSITTSLPFLVHLSVVNDHDKPMSEYAGNITIHAITSKVCLAEGFERKNLGLWQPAFLPGHYEHGFDAEVHAPDSLHSLFLKGGNDSNFGMTLKLPSPAASDDMDATHLRAEAEIEDASVFNGSFRPDSVSFYVRTDNDRADAGHFILGESNEVNKRVAQFQFTKDGRMGLLGTGGTTHGATPYKANRWYHIELRFDWERKTVAFYVDHMLQQRQIPFRRETSSFIGACALGNRDRCTTWFDSIKFVKEMTLMQTTVASVGGEAEVWLGPLREECAREGFVLRAEDCAGHVSDVAGPLYPLGKIEGAQRVAINDAALSDFTELLREQQSSDVIFVVEDREIHAHRCILTARCEAFRGMFNSSMREGSKNEKVVMHEVTYAAFQCMLQFIYGGAVQVPEELAVELLGLADRYLLDGLKLLCGFTLAKMVSIDSVSRILQAADRWDSPSSALKQKCMDFVLQNYEGVVCNPIFEELASSPHLLLEITRASVQIVKQPSQQWASYGSNPSLKRLRRN